MSAMKRLDYGIDFGGTSIRFGPVDRNSGKVIGKVITLDSQQFETNQALTRGLREALPEGCNIFVGAAGLPEGLQIKQSPNSSIKSAITFPEDLSRDGHEVRLINDMVASICGVVLYGPGKDRKVASVGTFSSGSNFAVFADGHLRSMEASHIQWPAIWNEKVSIRSQIWQYVFRKSDDFSFAPIAIQGMDAYNSRHTASELSRLGLKPLKREDLSDPDNLARALFALDSYPEAIVLNGKLLTAKGLASDTRLFCGCDGQGHIEPLVSGNGAAWIAQRYFLEYRMPDHRIMLKALADYNEKYGFEFSPSDLEHDSIYPVIVRSITAKNVYDAYREAPEVWPQCAIRNIQVDAIAASIGILTSYHMPEVLVCQGSMTKDWNLLFAPAIERVTPGSSAYQSGHYFIGALKPPEVIKNENEHLGLVGAVAYGVLQERR